jgi:hypothetical protein
MSEQAALIQLKREKTRFKTHIKLVYEPAARDCGTCLTAGVCCTDAHFVNVHISRLEAVAIHDALRAESTEVRNAVYARAHEAVRKYDLLAEGDSFAKTYSCPLFQPGVGCMVHRTAKPAPCIHHACYDNADDLPPESLLGKVELQVEELNRSVYGEDWTWLPIPVWLTSVDPDPVGDSHPGHS